MTFHELVRVTKLNYLEVVDFTCDRPHYDHELIMFFLHGLSFPGLSIDDLLTFRCSYLLFNWERFQINWIVAVNFKQAWLLLLDQLQL